MKVSVIGTGYVGLVTAACLADMGNAVAAVDLSQEKVANLRAGRIPIHEPGLQPLVERNLRAGRLRFTDSHAEGIADAEVIFIAVGTPSQEDGSADLRHVLDVAGTIGRLLTRAAVIVDKSTVPVGTADQVRRTVQQALDARGVQIGFDVVSNPEFLKEGAAVADFQRPDRIIVGTDSPRAIEVMKELYGPFSRSQDKFIVMDTRSAELSKYAANAMLATRISFMNEIAAVAEATGADIESVRRGIGADPRIGPLFLYAGAGFGGSCFPKDLRALLHLGHEASVPLELLQSVVNVNERQKTLLFRRIDAFFKGQLKDRRVAVWGLAFKPETDDVREAPSLSLIVDLVRAGARVTAYDPQATETAQGALQLLLSPQEMQRVQMHPSARAAAEGADVLALMTEWKEFRSPDFAWLAATLGSRAVFDGRNQYRPEALAAHGLAYFGIGRPAPAGRPPAVA
ncbi:MAG: UDP-glucose/GDP-mannose dehydrogenase family protein [Burkholderiaceae bacterium]|nr:UDP-glucose/GDP-mannose dehydrogenase family protein [Burkholderiaceae bacterium]MDO9089693.1 UDP-glucose/GDP-mannose dehydrogenase family protein [Burkholderiaceae bacterium]